MPTILETEPPAGLANHYSARFSLSRKKLHIRIRRRRAITTAEWVAMVLSSEEFRGRRSDGQATIAAVVTAVAASAWGPGLTTRTTWDKLAAAAGVSRRHIARVLAWLRSHGFLHTRTHGKTARWSTSGRNEAPVYQITVQGAEMVVVDEQLGADIAKMSPLLCPVVQVVDKPHAREGFRHGAKRRVSRDDTNITKISLDKTVKTKREALQWALTLRENAEELASMSVRRLRWLTKALWVNGWTVKDALGALVIAPDGSQWAASGGHIRSPEGFAASKLQRWAETGLGPEQAVRDRGHQVLIDAAHAATKVPDARGNGGETPDYTDAHKVVRATMTPARALHLARTHNLLPWEVVRIGIERRPGVREVVATLTCQHPSVDLPGLSGRVFVRVDNNYLHSDVLLVDVSRAPEDDNGLGFLAHMFGR